MARAIWTGAISFGLLNIPIEVLSSKQEDRISFSLLDKKNHGHIGYRQYNKATGKEVSRADIVKGYEYENDQFVIISDKDIKEANPKATQTIDIEDFVDLEELDILYFEKPYYLLPGKNGEKGYVLLREVLQETKKVAIAKFVMRQRQYLVSVMPRGDYLILEILRFAHEIKDLTEAQLLDNEKLKRVKVSEREIEMAKQLVEGMTSAWKPEKYKDTYQEDLMKMIQRKIKKGDTKTAEPSLEAEPKTNTNIVDLMPLLKKSLESATPSKTTSKSKRKKSSA